MALADAEAFDYGAFQEALTEQRLSLSVTQDGGDALLLLSILYFNPAKHPRDPKGHFREVAAGTALGEQTRRQMVQAFHGLGRQQSAEVAVSGHKLRFSRSNNSYKIEHPNWNAPIERGQASAAISAAMDRMGTEVHLPDGSGVRSVHSGDHWESWGPPRHPDGVFGPHGAWRRRNRDTHATPEQAADAAWRKSQEAKQAAEAQKAQKEAEHAAKEASKHLPRWKDYTTGEKLHTGMMVKIRRATGRREVLRPMEGVIERPTDRGGYYVRVGTSRQHVYPREIVAHADAPMHAAIDIEAYEEHLHLARQRASGAGVVSRGSGDKSAVKAVQQRLTELGYGVNTDGDFGSETEKALKAFQKSRNAKVDGVVGKETLGKLIRSHPSKNANAADTGLDAVQKAVGTGQPVTASSGRGLGNALARQRGGGTAARSGGGASTPGAIPGASRTTLNTKDPQAVRTFQQAHNLKVDGIVGPQTQGMMNRVNTVSGGTGTGSTGTRGGATQTSRSRATTGRSGQSAQRTQAGAGTTTIDPATGAPVANASTGPIGSTKVQQPTSTTWEGGKHPRVPAGQPGGGKFAASGSSGEQVQNTQKALNVSDHTGHSQLKVDGQFGDKTEARVKQFQKNANLKVDGIVGPQTSAALRKRVNWVSKQHNLSVRDEHARLDLAVVRFDPAKHPRGLRGEFRKAVEGLKPGGKIVMPRGVVVFKQSDGRLAVARNGIRTHVGSVDAIAEDVMPSLRTGKPAHKLRKGDRVKSGGADYVVSGIASVPVSSAYNNPNGDQIDVHLRSPDRHSSTFTRVHIAHVMAGQDGEHEPTQILKRKPRTGDQVVYTGPSFGDFHTGGVYEVDYAGPRTSGQPMLKSSGGATTVNRATTHVIAPKDTEPSITKLSKAKRGLYANADGTIAVVADGYSPSQSVGHELNTTGYEGFTAGEWALVYDTAGRLREDGNAGSTLDWFPSKSAAEARIQDAVNALQRARDATKTEGLPAERRSGFVPIIRDGA